MMISGEDGFLLVSFPWLLSLLITLLLLNFAIKHGIKQGDLLSPFILILSTKGLHIALSEAKSRNISMDFVQLTLTPLSPIFSLQMMQFLQVISLLKMVKHYHICEMFFLTSKIKINLDKTNVLWFGVYVEDVNEMSTIMGQRSIDYLQSVFKVIRKCFIC